MERRHCKQLGQGSTGQARGALPQIRGGHYPTSPQSPNLKIQMPPFDNPNLTNVQLQKNIQYSNQLSNQSLHHGHMTHPKTVHGDTPRQKIQISQQCTNTFVSHSNQYCHTHGQPKHKNSHDHHHSQTALKTNQHLASLHHMLKSAFGINSSFYITSFTSHHQMLKSTFSITSSNAQNQHLTSHYHMHK